MGYTRQDFIDGALEEIGIATFAFDLASEQIQSCGRRLDRMMAEWNAKGVRLGYPLPASPNDSTLNEETNVPDSAWQAITTNLALRIAPMFGKSPLPETKVAARQSWTTLLALFTRPPQMQVRQLPAGAGNKPWRWGNPFTAPPVEPLTAGPDSELELG